MYQTLRLLGFCWKVITGNVLIFFTFAEKAKIEKIPLEYKFSLVDPNLLLFYVSLGICL